jgi:DNA-binding CsgD family transcriptional regulator
MQVDVDGAAFLVIEWAPRELPGLAILTATERHVAELASGGATNAEIALARGTSVRTVANQIASIMRKLGVSSRVAIAAVVAGRR